MKNTALLLLVTVLSSSVLFAQEKKRGGYDFHMQKAKEYFEQKEYELAKESFKSAVRSKRNNPEAYLLRANIAMAEDNRADAINYLNRASRIGSETADKLLIDMGAEPWRALNDKEAQEFNNDLENYFEVTNKEANTENKKKKKDKKKTHKQ